LKHLVMSTARGGLRGIATAAAITGGGVLFNVLAFALLLRAIGAPAAGVGWLAASLLVPLALAGALLFSVGYLLLAQWYGRRVALRTWYEAHRELVLRTLDETARRAAETAPSGAAISRGAWSRVSAGLRAAPRPLRVIAGWALKRVGAHALLGMVEGGPGSGAARLDAFIRGELLAVGMRPLWILAAANAAAVVGALLWVRW
jgi:hypothetical protein